AQPDPFEPDLVLQSLEGTSASPAEAFAFRLQQLIQQLDAGLIFRQQVEAQAEFDEPEVEPLQGEHEGGQARNQQFRTAPAELPAEEAEADGGQHGNQFAAGLHQAADQAQP
ncbi:MAG: hypothetical protein ACK56F_21830, partial [bacterium]